MHASAPGANVPPPADQDAQQQPGAPGLGGPAMTHTGWPSQGLLDPGTKGGKGFIGDMNDQPGLTYNMGPTGAVLFGLDPAGGLHSLHGSHSLQATSTTIMDHPGLQPTESSAVYPAGLQLPWPGARGLPAQHQAPMSMHALLQQQAQPPHQHRMSMGPPAAQQYPQQLQQQQEQQLHIAQLQAQLPHQQQQQQQQQLPHGGPRGPIGSSPLLQPQLTESSVFARNINPALQHSRVDPVAAEAAAAGEAAAAAGLAGPQGPMQGGIQGSVQGSVQLPGAAGSQQGRESFTGFTPGPGGASLGSAPMWMAGAQQQGPVVALGAMSQGLPGSMGPPHSISSSGLSGPSSLGAPDSELALLQAALRGGGSDDILRLYAMKKLLGDGSSGGGGGGGGVDVTTLLLLQSMNRDQRGGQQGSNDMLIQLLLQQRQQGQGQLGQQQQSQVLQALLAQQQQQQQQQQPSQMQPPSLLEAPASTTGGPGSSGAWGAVTHSTAAAAAAAWCQQQPAAAVQPQQQKVVPGAVFTPPAASQPAVFSSLAAADQKPPEAAADTKQQQQLQQEEAAAAAAATAAATTPSSEAKDTPGVAAQQPDKAAPPAAPAATKETPKQQQPAAGQEQQKAKPAEQAAARAAATAAAAAAGLDPAAAAAMPVNDAADQELEQLVADTLMYMAAPQAGTRSPSGAATAAAAPAAAAGATAVSAGLAAVPGAVPLKVEQQQGGAESAATAGLSQEQQQQDDDKDMLPAAGDSYQDEQGQGAADQQQQQQPVELQEPEPDVPRQEPEEGLWQGVLHHLFFYLQEDIQALEALAGTQPAAKKPRPSPADGPLPPDRTALSDPDRQALDEVLTLLKERQTPVGDGFWQRAWHHVQRYLRLTDDSQQQQQSSEPSDAASVGSKRNLKDAASVEPVPLQDLPPPEAAALQKILEPIRKDQIATLQQRLEGLAGYGQQLPGVPGADAGASDPAAAAAAAAAAANAMMMQQMGYPSFDPTYGAWGMYGMGEGDEGGYDMGQWAGGYGRAIRGRGGRPKGSGNRVQMAPRPPAPDAAETSQAKFSLRSVKYTGVYRSRRSQEGWRAQFCYANKVINLGTFATEEEAARVWNEAALLFRGADAWLNPVEPQLPEDYKAGELHLASDKAASAVIAAAVAAGLPQPKVVVKPQ